MKRCLIPDDDRALPILPSSRVRANRWMVDVAHDAMQGPVSAIRAVPGAVLLDVEMPRGTGIDAPHSLLLTLLAHDHGS